MPQHARNQPHKTPDTPRVCAADVLFAVDELRRRYPDATEVDGRRVVEALAPAHRDTSWYDIELITPQVLGILHELVGRGNLAGTVRLDDPGASRISLST